MADLACFSLAVTMASPVAWEHHYAILLPMLIWLWFADYGLRDKGRWGLVFAVIWVVSADYLSPADLVASIPGLNILQSTLYLAAWAVFILLMKSDSRMQANTDRVRETLSGVHPFNDSVAYKWLISGIAGGGGGLLARLSLCLP